MTDVKVGDEVWILEYGTSPRKRIVTEVDGENLYTKGRFWPMKKSDAFASEADAVNALLDRAEQNIVNAEKVVLNARRRLKALRKKYGR